ncbi:MAG: hypothetical protein WBA93_36740 [Microcoleaceae cyanobacterium]
MAFKKYDIKPYGNPNFDNASQTSNPATPQEKVQAISDLLEVRLKGEIVQQWGERGLLIKDIQRAMGTDGDDDLKTFNQQLENNFSGMATGKQQPKVDKDKQPELKKVSKEKAVDIPVPGSKGFGGTEKGGNKGKK